VRGNKAMTITVLADRTPTPTAETLTPKDRETLIDRVRLGGQGHRRPLSSAKNRWFKARDKEDCPRAQLRCGGGVPAG
jgi:hypothetical protein